MIFMKSTRATGHPHPHLQDAIANYTALLQKMGFQKEQIEAKLKQLGAIP